MFLPILSPRVPGHLIQIDAPVLEIAIANGTDACHDADMTVPNLRHLQAFHEVMATGSISAASVRMHLTQSAVTQAIAAIERYFERAIVHAKPLRHASHAGGHGLRRTRRARVDTTAGWNSGIGRLGR